MIIDDVMKDKITLHGLGFIQVQLASGLRMHVWHPDLPRRSCFESSAIHDHRFSFESHVIVGTQINQRFRCMPNAEGQFALFLHEGKRQEGGGRPWTFDGYADMIWLETTEIPAGGRYTTEAYAYHRTTPGGDGRVATIMRKTNEFPHGAHSTCAVGVVPDSNFDRYQLSPEQLWEVVQDVLLS